MDFFYPILARKKMLKPAAAFEEVLGMPGERVSEAPAREIKSIIKNQLNTTTKTVNIFQASSHSKH
ncbi:MAG: hypothetical protein J0H55_15630 [Chitinophagaceae bacterium]|nr:hypothetical protein [Chitinophagaceae bacterium]